MIEEIIINPIGVIRSSRTYRYESPRQGVLRGGNQSIIELNPHKNFEQALQDLAGFERIWVIYWFHLNHSWKPMVNPPRNSSKKRGVFATRSPHRPNNIGISSVKLEKVDGLKIFISESEILDGSPVLDIKPYLPYSDAFPDAQTGWLLNESDNEYTIYYESEAQKQIDWLRENSKIELENFIGLQLEYNPKDNKKKRIFKDSNCYVLAYRTWRIFYSIKEDDNMVVVKYIASGYTEEELEKNINDKYMDKSLHKDFIKKFINR
ncbi:MAG: tRNA (N6-threonylcarbamoyladenosine(37)-N6)-methyltransferase TrmO [Bacteroidetes bacterium]|nr:tRNA (N6-threonylcarbamoyladenosine(37)-N6)-methyltransferase TrmO [Bacteroidota bacterium]